jgi:predicted TIM-barrel fold metal-dependent hydrolase
MTRRTLLTTAASLHGATAALPANACDTHTHVFPDPAQFPFSPQRTYTPPLATPHQLSALHRKLGVRRAVIVTPSVYGADNSATLHGLYVLGSRARGVAVIDAATSQVELNRLHRAGVRGVRINLGSNQDPQLALARFLETQHQIQALPWHIQIYCSLPVLEALARPVRAAQFPVVLDHVGAANPVLGPGQPGFNTMLELMREGRLYVKATHRFLETDPAAGFRLLAPLIDANPERILWGTDWPHPGPPAPRKGGITPFSSVDDSRLLMLLLQQIADFRQLIFSINPARLYFY